jgi:hypothetical protein
LVAEEELGELREVLMEGGQPKELHWVEECQDIRQLSYLSV